MGWQQLKDAPSLRIFSKSIQNPKMIRHFLSNFNPIRPVSPGLGQFVLLHLDDFFLNSRSRPSILFNNQILQLSITHPCVNLPLFMWLKMVLQLFYASVGQQIWTCLTGLKTAWKILLLHIIRRRFCISFHRFSMFDLQVSTYCNHAINSYRVPLSWRTFRV